MHVVESHRYIIENHYRSICADSRFFNFFHDYFSDKMESIEVKKLNTYLKYNTTVKKSHSFLDQ